MSNLHFWSSLTAASASVWLLKIATTEFLSDMAVFLSVARAHVFSEAANADLFLRREVGQAADE
jgi:hypothetical protein